MALHIAGTNSTTSLSGITFAPAQGVGVTAAASILSPADLAAISESITGDGRFAAVNSLGVPGATGILATGSTHSNTTLDTLVSTGGGPLAAINVGQLVLGWNSSAIVIPPGTFVTAKPTGTSVTLSQAAAATVAGLRVAFIPPSALNSRLGFEGFLEIPGRGTIKVYPGDKILIDNTGWPIVLSAATVAYAGSIWTFT